MPSNRNRRRRERRVEMPEDPRDTWPTLTKEQVTEIQIDRFRRQTLTELSSIIRTLERYVNVYDYVVPDSLRDMFNKLPSYALVNIRKAWDKSRKLKGTFPTRTIYNLFYTKNAEDVVLAYYENYELFKFLISQGLEGKIKSLRMVESGYRNIQQKHRLLRSSTSLIHLDLSGCHMVDDEVLHIISENMLSLEVLNLSATPLIEEEFVYFNNEETFCKLKELYLLNLPRCYDVELLMFPILNAHPQLEILDNHHTYDCFVAWRKYEWKVPTKLKKLRLFLLKEFAWITHLHHFCPDLKEVELSISDGLPTAGTTMERLPLTKLTMKTVIIPFNYEILVELKLINMKFDLSSLHKYTSLKKLNLEMCNLVVNDINMHNANSISTINSVSLFSCKWAQQECNIILNDLFHSVNLEALTIVYTPLRKFASAIEINFYHKSYFKSLITNCIMSNKLIQIIRANPYLRFISIQDLCSQDMCEKSYTEILMDIVIGKTQIPIEIKDKRRISLRRYDNSVIGLEVDY